MKSGYYLCEVKGIFNKGTYQVRLFYDESTNRFLLDNANITKRVVRVIENE